MGLGIKIGGLSLDKMVDVNQVAQLAIKAAAPLNNLTVCTKLAESLLYGVLRKNSIERNFQPSSIKPTEIKTPDKFSN